MHDLERDNPGIEIPDAAFERVFNFFDGYRWHLDERPYREDNEINPDVLGYIFEKYVNQKQMGATIPRRTSPATSRATPSSPSCSTPPGRSAPWPSGRTAASGGCCATTQTATSTPPSATALPGTPGRWRPPSPSTYAP